MWPPFEDELKEVGFTLEQTIAREEVRRARLSSSAGLRPATSVHEVRRSLSSLDLAGRLLTTTYDLAQRMKLHYACSSISVRTARQHSSLVSVQSRPPLSSLPSQSLALRVGPQDNNRSSTNSQTNHTPHPASGSRRPPPSSAPSPLPHWSIRPRTPSSTACSTPHFPPPSFVPARQALIPVSEWPARQVSDSDSGSSAQEAVGRQAKASPPPLRSHQTQAKVHQ